MLREVQKLFWELISAPEGVDKALAEREARGEPVREVVAGVFAGDARLPAEERLDVYASMYFYRLRDVLAEDFARTAAVLGEERWHNLVTDFLLAHPSRHWSLRWAGEALPAFLRSHELGAGRRWLADVAALEAARNEAFLAKDAARPGVEALAGIPAESWPSLAFSPAPGVSLLDSERDLAGWWAAGGAGEPAEIPGGQTLLVTRDAGDEARHDALSPEEVPAARRLLAGAPFAEVCEAFAPEGVGEAEAEEAGRKAVDLLVRLIALGAVLRAPEATGGVPRP